MGTGTTDLDAGGARDRTRHLLVTLAAGEAPGHVPSYLDHLSGAGRRVASLDGGPVDLALDSGGGFRALGVYHAAASLGRVGEQGARWNDVEQELGLARTYQVEIADAAAAQRVVDRLRSLRTVESAHLQTLATAPFAVATAAAPDAVVDSAWAPHDRCTPPRRTGSSRATSGSPSASSTPVSRSVIPSSSASSSRATTPSTSASTRRAAYGSSATRAAKDFTPSDAVGHGSHVGGIVGATGWELPPGIGGLALMLPVRVLAAALSQGSSRPSGIGAEANINAGIKVAVDLGADVLNLSFGTSEHDLDRRCAEAPGAGRRLCGANGCVLVAASGNTGVVERYYPAALPEVIAVGSVDGDGNRSTFSSYGDHVALARPASTSSAVGSRA